MAGILDDGVYRKRGERGTALGWGDDGRGWPPRWKAWEPKCPAGTTQDKRRHLIANYRFQYGVSSTTWRALPITAHVVDRLAGGESD
jgi:hypothetical protein